MNNLNKATMRFPNISKLNLLKNKFSFALLLAIFAGQILSSCGGGGRDEPTPVPNTPPTVPTLVGPADKSICISNVVPLSWNAANDAQNDAVTYQYQVSTDNQFSQIAASGTSSTPYVSVTLEKGKAFYWRVKAVDSKNAGSDYSATFSFYTEGNAVSNHLPFMPELVKPLENSTVGAPTVDLEWKASDVDTADQLTFDVYLGTTTTNMVVTKSNLTTKSTQLTSLAANTTYYWKVVVKDGKGGEAIGQIWSFKTS